MKLTLLLILVIAATYGVVEGCTTSWYCHYHQMWCDYGKKYWGLKYYKYCLTSLCETCSLCGVCDGEEKAIKSTREERLQCVTAHNDLRKYHENTGPLEWDEDLSEESQKYAEYLVNTMKLEHGTVGENLFLKCGSNGTTIQSCNSATHAWYDEINNLDWKTFNSTTHEDVGHFMQVVWKKAKKIGVGIAVHKQTKFVYVVTRYDSFIGDGTVKNNVLPRIY